MKTYFIEELDLNDLDKLIEKGECFDVRSTAALLSDADGARVSDTLRDSGNRYADDI